MRDPDRHLVPRQHEREPAAKLLLALVILHPQPLNIEQAADLLWPGLDLRRAAPAPG